MHYYKMAEVFFFFFKPSKGKYTILSSSPPNPSLPIKKRKKEQRLSPLLLLGHRDKQHTYTNTPEATRVNEEMDCMKTQVDRLVRLECTRELRVLGRKCPGEREEAAWVLALYVVCTLCSMYTWS